MWGGASLASATATGFCSGEQWMTREPGNPDPPNPPCRWVSPDLIHWSVFRRDGVSLSTSTVTFSLGQLLKAIISMEFLHRSCTHQEGAWTSWLRMGWALQPLMLYLSHLFHVTFISCKLSLFLSLAGKQFRNSCPLCPFNICPLKSNTFQWKLLHYLISVLILGLSAASASTSFAAVSGWELVKEAWLSYLFSQPRSNSFSWQHKLPADCKLWAGSRGRGWFAWAEGLNSDTQWFLLSHPCGSAGTGTRTGLSCGAISSSHHLPPCARCTPDPCRGLKINTIYRWFQQNRRGLPALRCRDTAASVTSHPSCPKHPNQQSCIVPTNWAPFDQKREREGVPSWGALRAGRGWVCRHKTPCRVRENRAAASATFGTAEHHQNSNSGTRTVCRASAEGRNPFLWLTATNMSLCSSARWGATHDKAAPPWGQQWCLRCIHPLQVLHPGEHHPHALHSRQGTTSSHSFHHLRFICCPNTALKSILIHSQVHLFPRAEGLPWQLITKSPLTIN